MKDLAKERKIYQKEHNKKCTQKNNKAFNNCDKKIFNKSKLSKLYGDLDNCTKRKCYTQKKKLNKYRNLHF